MCPEPYGPTQDPGVHKWEMLPEQMNWYRLDTDNSMEGEETKINATHSLGGKTSDQKRMPPEGK